MSAKARSEHFLLQVERLIDWAPLVPLMQPAGGSGLAGPSPAVAKMQLLARWYAMNEAALLEACQDRMSFRRFLDLPLTDNSGDAALRDAFRRHTLQAPMDSQRLIEAIEAQLLAKGFSIKPGKWAEAIVVPAPGQSAANKGKMAATATFQAGEIDKLIARSQGLAQPGGARGPGENLSDRTDPDVLQARVALDAAPVKASLEWPWGAVTRLGDRLTVGRDHRICPYAAELIKYPHISRKHAELTACPVGVWVRDLHSHNGTFVNDEQLAKGNAHLVDSDAQIRFGPYCVVQLKLEF